MAGFAGNWCCDDSALPLAHTFSSPTFQQILSVRGWEGDVHPRQYPLPRSPCPTGRDHTPNECGLPGIPPAHGCSAGRPPHVPTTPHTGIETLTAVQAVIRVGFLRAVSANKMVKPLLCWCLWLDYQQQSPRFGPLFFLWDASQRLKGLEKSCFTFTR